VAADVLRGNALSWLAARVRVVDEAGRPVDMSAGASAGHDGAGEDAESAADDDGEPDGDGEDEG
jgi:hypothetical protein